MKKILASLAILAVLISCDTEENQITNTVAPDTYSFNRDGVSTISFEGQTTRIKMGNELGSALKKPNEETLASLNAKFAHTEGENNFSDVDLNSSSKNIRSKTASSIDFYATNSTDANAIRTDFDSWITGQANEVFPNWAVNASAGVAGQIQEAGGGAIRWVNTKGLEYDQAIVKGLIGGLMVDQILNNYLSTAVLDAATNVADNDAEVLISGKNYTSMEHKWDEAFGYMYGTEPDITAPILNTDSFLNKYLNRVVGDTDFANSSTEIYNAFKLGRAAIVANDYSIRDLQAEILREKISEIIGIRSVYYLVQGANNVVADKASAFHDLSEGFGFIYSLQFTRKPNSTEPYFTRSEVDGFIATLLAGNGFWDRTPAELEALASTIATKFNFTVAQAGSTN